MLRQTYKEYLLTSSLTFLQKPQTVGSSSLYLAIFFIYDF